MTSLEYKIIRGNRIKQEFPAYKLLKSIIDLLAVFGKHLTTFFDVPDQCHKIWAKLQIPRKNVGKDIYFYAVFV